MDFDRAGLLGLLQDLYAANKDNQAFLHARLSLGDDVLKPYKTAIDRWLWPDVRIIDFVDTGHPALLRMWDKRQRGYRTMGYRIAGENSAN